MFNKLNRVTPEPARTKAPVAQSTARAQVAQESNMISGSKTSQNPPSVSSKGENNSQPSSKGPQSNIGAAPKPKVPSPFNIALHEVLMPSKLDLPAQLKTNTGAAQSKKPKFGATQPRVLTTRRRVLPANKKAAPMRAKKRRKSNPKPLKTAEYLQLFLQQQEKDTAEELEKFEAAKARVTRRHTYGTHVQEKFIQMMHEKKRVSQVSPNIDSPQEKLPNSKDVPIADQQKLSNLDSEPETKENRQKTVKKQAEIDLRKPASSRVIMVDSVWVKNVDSDESWHNTNKKKISKPNKIANQPFQEQVPKAQQAKELNPNQISTPQESNKQTNKRLGHTVINIPPTLESGPPVPKPDLQDLQSSNPKKPKKPLGLLESRILKPSTSLPVLLTKSKTKAPLVYGAMPKTTYKQEAYDQATELVDKGSITVLQPQQKGSKPLPKPVEATKRSVEKINVVRAVGYTDLKTNPLKTDALKTDALKTDALKTDALKTDALKTDALKTDALKTDALKTDALKTDALKTDTLKTDQTVRSSSREAIPISGEILRLRRLTPDHGIHNTTAPQKVPEHKPKRHIRIRFDPKRQWQQAFERVKKQLKIQKLQRERDLLTDNESSSSSDPTNPDLHLDESTIRVKKRGCFGKIMNFFKESDDSDQKRETVMERKRHHLEQEKEEQYKLRKHKRKMRKKAMEKLSRTQAKATLDNLMSTIHSRIVDNHQLGLAMAKEANPEQGLTPLDPLALSNIKHVSTYREFAKNAHGALPSRQGENQDNPTAPILPILNKADERRHTAPDTTKADDTGQKIRSVSQDSLIELGDDPLVGNTTDLRAIPGNISQKRGVKNKREKEAERKAREHLNHRLMYCLGNCLMKFRRTFREFGRFSEIWHSSIHRIDGHFGVGPATYFRWLRAVVLLNAFYVIFSFSFLLFPEMRTATLPSNNESLRFTDFFLAEGYIGKSLMFYGAYQFEDDRESYFKSTGFRYVFVILVIFVFNSIFIGSRVREYYDHTIANVSERDQKGELDLFSKVLCSWDFNITNQDSAYCQHRSIARDFTYEVDVQKKNSDTVAAEHQISAKWLGRHRDIIMHWIFNLALIFMVCAFGALMYFLLKQRLSSLAATDSSTSCYQHLNSLWDVVTPTCFSFLTGICTPLCIWATNAESWTSVMQRTYYLIVRVALVYIAMISVLYVFWLDSSIINWAGTQCCWENEFGNELYRIIVFDAISNLLINICTYKIYPFFVKKCLKRAGPELEFQVEGNQINLIFIHTMSGMGIFYCPVLPFIILVRLIITFYWQKYLLFSSCCFPRSALHQRDIYAPYLAAFFMSYLMVTIMNTWIVAEVKPSSSCGPFRNYTKFSDVFHRAPTGDLIAGLLEFITEAQFAYFCLFFGAGVVFTFRAWGKAYSDTIKLLHELLQLERLDRDFLLKAMYNIAKMNETSRSEAGINAANDVDQRLLDTQMEIAAKPYLAKRRGALPEAELRTGIMEFMEKQARLDELLADDQADHGRHEAVLDIDQEPRPPGYPLQVTLSPKAIRRLRNRRLSIPAALFVEAAEAYKLKRKSRDLR